MHMVRLMTRLMLVSLDDTVVFPGMPVTLAVDPGADRHIFLMPRQGNKYAKVGVVAEVTERVQLPGGRGFAVSLMGLHRGTPGAAETDPDGRLRVTVEERPRHRSASGGHAGAGTRLSCSRRGDPRAEGR